MDDEALPPMRLVEAALFTAGRPVSIDELVVSTGLDAKAVKRAVKALEMEYDERGDQTALEVGQAGDKWAMQLKAAYVVHARTLAEMEIPKKLLKTLALIAFHQPLLQSELVDMIGTKTYDHVGELVEVGLVKARQDGVSKRLTTSPTFPEYFGIPATDTHEIRTFLAKKVGLTLKTKAGEAQLDAFSEAPKATGNRLAPYAVVVPEGLEVVAAHPRGVKRAPAEATADDATVHAEDASDASDEAVQDDDAEPEAAAVTLDALHSEVH